MGWTYTHRPKGYTTAQFFQNILTGKILEHATVDGVFYAAYQLPAPNDHKVVALVFLTQRAKDHHDFGWKEMAEFELPYYFDAPARVLDKLTDPAHNENAVEWRKTCRERLNRPVIKTGDRIVFDHALTFGRYGEFAAFTVADAKRLHLQPEGKDFLVRIRKDTIKNHAHYTVTPA